MEAVSGVCWSTTNKTDKPIIEVRIRTRIIDESLSKLDYYLMTKQNEHKCLNCVYDRFRIVFSHGVLHHSLSSMVLKVFFVKLEDNSITVQVVVYIAKFLIQLYVQPCHPEFKRNSKLSTGSDWSNTLSRNPSSVTTHSSGLVTVLLMQNWIYRAGREWVQLSFGPALRCRFRLWWTKLKRGC